LLFKLGYYPPLELPEFSGKPIVLSENWLGAKETPEIHERFIKKFGSIDTFDLACFSDRI
jgi:hypothetical protein